MIINNSDRETLTILAINGKALEARRALVNSGRTKSEALSLVNVVLTKPVLMFAIRQRVKAKLAKISKDFFLSAKDNEVGKLVDTIFVWTDAVEEAAMKTKINKMTLKEAQNSTDELIKKYDNFINYEINRKLRFTLVSKSRTDLKSEYIIHLLKIAYANLGVKPMDEICKILTSSLRNYSNKLAADHAHAEVVTVELENGDITSVSNTVTSCVVDNSEEKTADVFNILLNGQKATDTENRYILANNLDLLKNNEAVKMIMKALNDRGLDIESMTTAQIVRAVGNVDKNSLKDAYKIMKETEELRADIGNDSLML